jgi:hypothetical protein
MESDTTVSRVVSGASFVGGLWHSGLDGQQSAVQVQAHLRLRFRVYEVYRLLAMFAGTWRTFETEIKVVTRLLLIPCSTVSSPELEGSKAKRARVSYEARDRETPQIALTGFEKSASHLDLTRIAATSFPSGCRTSWCRRMKSQGSQIP